MTAVTVGRSTTPGWVPIAFAGVVLLGGLNAVGVRTMNGQLAPLWGATLRFGIGAAVLLLIVLWSRTPLPRGRALVGSALYGAFGFAGAFGFIHWALVRVPPASVQVLLALVPLATLLLAVAQGLEQLRLASLVGVIVAFVGIALIFAEQLGSATPAVSLAAVVLGALCMAESNVVVKRFPKCHPLANNAVAMVVGAGLLLAASLATGETWALPSDGTTWIAVAYVSLAGTAVVFTCFVLVVRHWTASAASYVMLLMPLVTVVAAWALIGQPLTLALFVGGSLVAAGVYLGVVGRRRRPTVGPPVAAPGSHSGLQPGCA